MVPSGFLSVLTRNLGPDSGCSRLKLVRLQWPESSGTEAEFSAALAVQTSMVAETNPKAVYLICLAEMIPIVDSHMVRPASLCDWSARQKTTALGRGFPHRRKAALK